MLVITVIYAHKIVSASTQQQRSTVFNHLKMKDMTEVK